MSHQCQLKQCGDKKYYCQVELALLIIGGKWKPLVLWFLGSDGVLRFSELKRAIPNITQKMLTQQLRELEKDDLIHREVYAQVPPKVEYSLTKVGESVMPLLMKLNDWGIWYEQIAAVKKKNRKHSLNQLILE